MATAKAASKGANSAPIPDEWDEIAPFAEARDMEEGDHFIARYLGAETKEVPDPNSEEEGGMRDTLLHEFREDGADESFSLWGSAGLDKRLADVSSGTIVKVQYDGIVPLKGGRTARNYRVWASRNQPL